MIKKYISAVLAAAMLCVPYIGTYAAESATAEKIYVDVKNGADDNAGTPDAPFKTIVRAAQKAKNLCTSEMSGNVEIILKDGIYTPDFTYREEALYDYDLTAEKPVPTFRENISVARSTLDFGSDLSGKNGYKVIFKSENKNGAVISGARNISGWEIYDSEKNIYRAPSQGIRTRQLYVDGVKQQRARTEIILGEKTDIFGTSLVKTQTGYKAELNGMQNWGNKDKIEFVYLTPEAWYAPRVKVKNITEDSGKMLIEMTNPAWELMLSNRVSINTTPSYIENAFELIDKDGEWYLDETQQYFYYKAPKGTDMNSLNVSANVLEELLNLAGNSETDKIENIKFDGIVFEGTTYLRPESANGYIDAQSNTIREIPKDLDAIHPTSAVTLRNAENISFENCVFQKIGSDCIKMEKGVQKTTVMGTSFTDIAGSAIVVGLVTEEYRKPKTKAETLCDITISNNYISGIANEYYSGVAISVGLAGNTTIANNEISNCSYSALHIGWGLYDDTETAAASQYGLLKGIKILSNKIYDTNQVLSDGAPIYVRGKTGAKNADPNIIKGNYLRRNGTRLFSGIYFDTAEGAWKVSENVIESVRRAFSGQALKYHHMGEKNYCRVYEDKLVTDANYNTENVIKINGSWTEEARSIIKNSGINDEFSSLRGYNPGELFNIYARQDAENSVGENITIPIISEDAYGNEISSGINFEFYEGDYLTENIFQHSLLDKGMLKKIKTNDLYKVKKNGEIVPVSPQQSAIWIIGSDKSRKQRAMYNFVVGNYIETENLSYTSDVDVAVSSESPTYHYPKITQKGQYIEYDVDFLSEGVYEIWYGNVYDGQISMKQRDTFGTYKVTVDGYRIGNDIDFYTNNTHNVYLGKYYAKDEGTKKLRFECVGKNEMSSGYRMAADSLCLYCVDSNHKKKITVSGKNFDGSGDVALFVKNENGIPVYADQAARTSDNKFAFEFMLDAEPGRYSVGLSSKKRNDKYTEAFELISGNNTNISLDSFCCKNAQGEPLSSFDLQNETEISFGLKRAGGGETQANIIMALYKDNKLIHSEKKSNVKIGTEVLPISFTYESTYDADRVSVYIWDEKLTPLFDAKMYENGKDVLISFN